MQLASFRSPDSRAATIGVVIDDRLVDLHACTDGALPASMIELLQMGDAGLERARAAAADAKKQLSRGVSAGQKSAPWAFPIDQVELLAPVPRPGKIIHTACNFGDHLSELTKWKAPEWQAHNWGTFHHEHPTGFLEAPSSVVGSGAAVARPVFTRQLDYEIELGIVIGRHAKNVAVEHALDYVAGYTVFNDLSARDIQAREHANKVVMLGKSFDGSCPFGPFLITRDEVPDPATLAMELRVNGEVRQSSNTAHMRFKPAELVSWWSLTTLEPGDIITSGSPAGVAAAMAVPRWLEPGDRIEANVERLGTLVTTIVEPQ